VFRELPSLLSLHLRSQKGDAKKGDTKKAADTKKVADTKKAEAPKKGATGKKDDAAAAPAPPPPPKTPVERIIVYFEKLHLTCEQVRCCSTLVSVARYVGLYMCCVTHFVILSVACSYVGRFARPHTRGDD